MKVRWICHTWHQRLVVEGYGDPLGLILRLPDGRWAISHGDRPTEIRAHAGWARRRLLALIPCAVEVVK